MQWSSLTSILHNSATFLVCLCHRRGDTGILGAEETFGGELDFNSYVSTLVTRKRLFSQRVVCYWTELPGKLSWHQICLSSRSIWMTFSAIWFSFRWSCKEQGIRIFGSYGSLPSWDSLRLYDKYTYKKHILQNYLRKMNAWKLKPQVKNWTIKKGALDLIQKQNIANCWNTSEP